MNSLVAFGTLNNYFSASHAAPGDYQPAFCLYGFTYSKAFHINGIVQHMTLYACHL